MDGDPSPPDWLANDLGQDGELSDLILAQLDAIQDALGCP